jgi:hypothetical protein
MSLKCLYVSGYEGRDKNALEPKNAANTGENKAKTNRQETPATNGTN